MTSGLPQLFTLRPSPKQYSLSRMTVVDRKTRTRCCSSSSLPSGFPSKFRTRKPSVLSLSRWSRGNVLSPWKCLRMSWRPCVKTTLFSCITGSRIGWNCWPHRSPQSSRRGASPLALTFSSRYALLEQTRRRGWPTSVSSPLMPLISITHGPGGKLPRPKGVRASSNSANNDGHIEEEKDRNMWKISRQYLLCIGGLTFCHTLPHKMNGTRSPNDLQWLWSLW